MKATDCLTIKHLFIYEQQQQTKPAARTPEDGDTHIRQVGTGNAIFPRLAATHRRKPSHGMDKEMQAFERGAQEPALCAHGKMFHPQTGGNHPETPGRTVRKD